MQSDKWTVEGAVKAVFFCEYSATQRQRYGRGVCWHSAKVRGIFRESRWYRRFIALLPVLVYLQGQAFLFSAAAISNKKTFRGDKMLNLSLDEVKAYAADYTDVPVARECFADMVTRNR